jgi:ubiquinol-cytochrome c reductase cytochrome b subunit/menaquinol-cytochrome c reductase cytochrome b/c subunit
LRVFKWPETVILGSVGIPTLCLILLIALPFLDRRAERRPLRRPVAIVAAILTIISMGVLTYKGATAKEALGPELIAAGVVDKWAEKQGFGDNAAAVAGGELFAESGCLNCHTYLGEGSSNLGAPELSDVGGRTKRGVDGFKDYISNPAAFGNKVMLSYAYLGDENLTNLATFLDASKGERAEP